MTLEEALEFFVQHGNVSRSASELMATRPTLGQLAAAAGAALANGADRAQVEAAKDAIFTAGHFRSMAP